MGVDARGFPGGLLRLDPVMWTGPDSRPPSLRHLCSGKGDEEQHQPPALVCREHPGDRHSRTCEAGRTMGVSITPQGEDAGCSDSRPCVAGAWFWVNTWGKRGAQGEHRTAPPLHPHPWSGNKDPTFLGVTKHTRHSWRVTVLQQKTLHVTGEIRCSQIKTQNIIHKNKTRS